MSDKLYPEHAYLCQSIVDTAKEFAANEGIELTRYYEYLPKHHCHAFNGVQKTDNIHPMSPGNWIGVRVIVSLDENGIVSAEVPRSNQKNWGHRTKSEAKF